MLQQLCKSLLKFVRSHIFHYIDVRIYLCSKSCMYFSAMMVLKDQNIQHLLTILLKESCV
jgi:hypothetical protein